MKALFWTAAAILLSLGVTTPGYAQAKSAGEYELKAAFLYNFTRFVEWPPNTLPANTPIRICVLGRNAFGPEFASAVEGKKVNGRAVKVEYVESLDSIKSCHVLFVSSSRTREMSQIVRRLTGASVLTVGDSPGFTRLGGVVNFVWDGNHVRFEISPANAEDARLKISAKLISLAKIVPDVPGS